MNHLYEHFTSYINISRARKNGPVRVYVSFGLERLVQSVAYFSRINGPNENSGGGGDVGEGQGFLISFLCYAVFLIPASCIQTYDVMFLNFAHSPSLLVVRTVSHPLVSHLACLCPLSPLPL